MIECATQSDTRSGTRRPRHFVTISGGKLKRERNRFGGELSYSERRERHESASMRAALGERLDRLTLREHLAEHDPACPATVSEKAALCPYLGLPVTSVTSFVTDDGTNYVSVRRDRGGRITFAQVRPSGRYYE